MFKIFNLSVAGSVAVAVFLLVSAIALLLVCDIGLFADAGCDGGGKTFSVVLTPSR